MGLLLGIPHPEAIEVGLVPDLEIPGAHLVGAVALGDVAGEGRDKRLPFCVVLRRGDVAAPPEDRLRAARHRRGHEPQLDEGLHADALNEIEQLIHILPVVDRAALLVLLVHAHVVAEQAMETDVAETALRAHPAELTLPVGTQALVGTPGAHTEVVHAVHLALRGRDIGLDHTRRRLHSQRGCQRNEKRAQQSRHRGSRTPQKGNDLRKHATA
ncbi:MAG: hypothetical protein BWX86_02826 [Verrucomicrobia bacterium ADurb.Bin122]|nr:MAG: hypothetical protein BWX86_02826 [Verrucomicrobia bacterium ADurb.Bin122]